MKTYLWGLAFLLLAVSCYFGMWAMQTAMLFNPLCKNAECIRITSEWMGWQVSGMLLTLLASFLSIYYALRKPKKKPEKDKSAAPD